MSARRLVLTEFDCWALENSISERFQFKKGWWDYVEIVRRLGSKLARAEVSVLGHYLVDTPPPQEQLPMPAVLLAGPRVQVALKWDFGATCRWPREWTLSIRRDAPYRGPTFGLFDPRFDLRLERADGLEPNWVFGPYCENQSEFSCDLEDEWDVAALLRLVFYEA